MSKLKGAGSAELLTVSAKVTVFCSNALSTPSPFQLNTPTDVGQFDVKVNS